MLKEFKEFAMRGNVMDMAIGIILGSAFGAIVSAVVDHLLMPVLSLLVGGIDFQNWFIALDGGSYQTLAQAQEAGAATLNYGLVLNDLYRVCDLPDGESHEQVETPRTRSCGYEILPVLPVGSPAGSDTLPALHIGTDSRTGTREIKWRANNG